MPNFQFRTWIASCLVAFFAGSAYGQSTTTWQGTTSGSWNNSSRWLPGLPTINLDAWISTTTGQTITNSGGTTDAARSLNFSGANHTLSGGNLWLQSGSISVDTTRTATINSSLAGASGLIKSGSGTLRLGNNTNLITGGISINAGTVNPVTSTALGNNPITINGTLDLSVNGGNNFIREFSGAGTFNKNYALLYVNALNDAEFSGGGTVSNAFFAGFVKTGPGTQTVTGGSWYIGTATSDDNSRPLFIYRGGWTFGGALGAVSGAVPNIVNGTLTIDDSSADINRVPDTSAVQFVGGGGTLRYKGGVGGAVSETTGDLGPAPGGNVSRGNFLTVNVQRNGSTTATLQFATYNVGQAVANWNSGNSMVNFTAGGGSSTDTLGTDTFVRFTTTTLRNNVLSGGFVNGRDIATYDATKGVVPFNAVGGGGVAYVAAVSAGTTDTAYVNGNYSLPSAKTWNALKIDGSPTINLNGNNLQVGSTSLGLMIVKTGGGEAVISNSGAAARYLQGVNDFAFYIDAAQTLKITAPLQSLANSGNGPYLRLNKAGPGLLWLAPTENWLGTTSGTQYGPGMRFSEGAIRMNPDLGGVGTAGRFQSQRMALNGGVMELDNMSAAYNPTIGTGAANLRWQSSGGFAAYGTDATFQPNITWNATDHIPDGAALLLNSTTADKKISLGLADGTSKLNLGTDATKMYLREIEVADNPNSTTDMAEIRSQIISDTTAGGGGTPTYTYHLLKTGNGILSLSHTNNDYSGATYVKAGTLLINGRLATPASSEVARNPEYTAVNVMSSGMLGGTGTISRVVRVESGGVLAPGDSTQALTTGIFTIGADASIVSGGTLALQINGATAGTLYDQLQLTSGNLNINSSSLSIDWGSFPTTSLTHLWIVNNTGAGTTTGTFAGFVNDATVNTVNGTEWKIRYNVDSSAATASTTPATGTGNDIVLYAIPEPSTLALVGCGLLSLVVCARRRLK